MFVVCLVIVMSVIARKYSHVNEFNTQLMPLLTTNVNCSMEYAVQISYTLNEHNYMHSVNIVSDILYIYEEMSRIKNTVE